MPMGIGPGLSVTRGGSVTGIGAIGADLALWFDTNQAYKSSGGGIVTPDSILTYTAPSPKLVYGSDGVLRYAPHNLILRSEEFDQTGGAPWILAATTVTANAAAAPDGTTTADKLVEDSANTNHHINQSVTTAAVSYTFSVYAKAAERSFISLLHTTSLVGKVFNLSNGTLGVNHVAAPAASTIEAVGNGWYRCSITVTGTAASNNFRIYIQSADAAVAYLGDGTSGVYIWGAQLNNGSSALTYIPTTTAAVYSLPRNHNPTTLAALGVLVEEQRTNLCLYSDDFTNAAWVKSNLTAAKTATGPDGVANSASTLTATAANATARQDITSASAARITSMFVKRRTGTGAVTVSQGETTGSELVTNGGFATDTDWTKGTNWTIAGGVAIATAIPATSFITQNISTTAGNTYKVVFTISGYVAGSVSWGMYDTGQVGTPRSANGTYTEYFVSTATSATFGLIRRFSDFTGNIDNISLFLVSETTVTVTSSWTRVATASATVTDPSVIVKLATSGDAIDVALFDHELGAFITSPIPTVASAVTRAADQISILTSAFPWTNTAMAAVMDFTPTYVDNGSPVTFAAFSFYSGATNYARMLMDTSGARTGAATAAVRNSSFVQIQSGSTAYSPGTQRMEWALSYDSTVQRASYDANTLGTETTPPVTLPTPTALWVGGDINGTTSINGHIKRFAHYASLKSQAELNTLTAL